MDFRLKVFQSVAQHLSFTKAAKELYLSQPAISKHIRELEQNYQIPLFDRMGNRIALTHAGELLLQHADRILDSYRKMDFEMNLLQANFKGELRIGASTTIAQYILPKHLATFIQKFPQIKVSLINGNSRDIEIALSEHRIDMGMVEGNSRNIQYKYSPFMPDSLVLVTSVNRSFSQMEEVDLELLKEIPLIIRESGSGSLEVLEETLLKQDIKLSSLKILLQLGSSESIKLFLENSDACAILSSQAVEQELASGKLKVIPIKGFRCERNFSFMQHQGQVGGVEEKFMHYICQQTNSCHNL